MSVDDISMQMTVVHIGDGRSVNSNYSNQNMSNEQIKEARIQNEEVSH